MAPRSFARNWPGTSRITWAVPRPLYFARHLTRSWGGPQIYISGRTGPHRGAQNNNTLARGCWPGAWAKPGSLRDRAGQHGVASATLAPCWGCPATLHGHRRHPAPAPQRHSHASVGAKVVPVGVGQPHLEGCHERRHPGLGHQRAPHPLCHRLRAAPPYPLMVRDFQAVIGREPGPSCGAAPAKLRSMAWWPAYAGHHAWAFMLS